MRSFDPEIWKWLMGQVIDDSDREFFEMLDRFIAERPRIDKEDDNNQREEKDDGLYDCQG